MTAALGLHVLDEALTGFLPLYNSTVLAARESIPWLPFPTFTFGAWLGGLVTVVILLFLATPLVRRRYAWLRPVSYLFAGLMFLNGVAHIAASFWIGSAAPGVYSAPLLMAVSIALLGSTNQARKYGGAGNG